MIHTKITANDTFVNVSFRVPKSYIGKELDIIAFKANEGFLQNTTASNVPEWHKAIVKNTKENLIKNPESAKNWEDVKKELDNEFL